MKSSCEISEYFGRILYSVNLFWFDITEKIVLRLEI